MERRNENRKTDVAGPNCRVIFTYSELLIQFHTFNQRQRRIQHGGEDEDVENVGVNPSRCGRVFRGMKAAKLKSFNGIFRMLKIILRIYAVNLAESQAPFILRATPRTCKKKK